jgi:hypothetical protein
MVEEKFKLFMMKNQKYPKNTPASARIAQATLIKMQAQVS